MGQKLQIKRGAKAALPALAVAELAMTTDEKTLYYGTGAENIPVARLNHSHTAAEVGAAPASHSHTAAQVGAAPASHSHTAAQVGAAPASHVGDASHVTAAEKQGWNSKAAGNHTHTAAQVGVSVFCNKTIPVADWVSNATYNASGYLWRATVVCAGVTVNDRPDVALSCTDALSGNFAPVAESCAGGVYLYCKLKPANTVTIPSILCVKGGA